MFEGCERIAYRTAAIVGKAALRFVSGTAKPTD
jgi:hypothetical protein